MLMAINVGKKFEQCFKNSCPEYCWLNRYVDGTSSWGGNGQVRFQATNICDFELLDTENKRLFLLELKSYAGKSLPISGIRPNQLEGLRRANRFNGVYACLLVNLRGVDKTFCVNIDTVLEFIELGERKSIPLVWFMENGIEIEHIYKRTRFTLNLDKFLKEVV